MKREEFLKLLKHNVIIADGAMGTMILRLADNPVACIEYENILHPELVKDIHQQYIRAGARLIETNTFGANRISLKRHNLDDKVEEINRKAVQIAKSVIEGNGFVAGSIGPIITSIKDDKELENFGLENVVEEQAKVLIEEGVDLILLETYTNVEQLNKVVSIIRHLTDLPIIASMTINKSGMTYDGYQLNTIYKKILDNGADVIGINCGYGIHALELALEKLSGIDVPISVMPNAGLPHFEGGRIVYGVSEEYFANKAERFVELGAKIIGGCCGSTPSHIEAVARRLKEKKIVHLPRKKKIIAIEKEYGFKKGRLLEHFEKLNHLPIICEIDPPGILNVEKQIKAIEMVKNAGADAISMAENPLATIKMSNFGFAAYLLSKINIDIILHITGRDRNLLGLQSLIMGAELLKISGLLMVTGDPSHAPIGPTNVFDVTSIGLLKLGTSFNNGQNLQGKYIKGETNFSLGCAVNPNVDNFTPQINHLKNKINSGARFTMTQPLFEKEKVDNFIEKVLNFDIKIFIGVFPILSFRIAEYLHNEVPGISIPEKLRTLLKQESDPERQKIKGIEYTKELVKGIIDNKRVDGLYLIAPHSDPFVLSDLVNFIRKELKV